MNDKVVMRANKEQASDVIQRVEDAGYHKRIKSLSNTIPQKLANRPRVSKTDKYGNTGAYKWISKGIDAAV